MATYTIHGYSTGGWDNLKTASFFRIAMKIAADTTTSFEPNSSSKVYIEKDGRKIKGWSGSDNGNWHSVTV